MKGTKVVLLAAGLGSRMGPYADIINKVLLPYNKKAIISHIIEQFPLEQEFIVAIGYKGEMVRDYLSIAHSDRNIQFVEVDNFVGPGAGPAHSVRCCKDYLPNDFLIVACDGLYSDICPMMSGQQNAISVAPVPEDKSDSYCNISFDKENNRLLFVEDKQASKSGWAASGLFYVYDHKFFWDNLSGTELSSGWNNDCVYVVDQIEWKDLGTYELYTQSHPNGEYDFSKMDEFIWDVNGKIIKWFQKPINAKNRVLRVVFIPELFPTITDDIRGFYAYEKVEGHTLYEECSVADFRELLKWLSFKLWKNTTNSGSCLSSETLYDFYWWKTLDRLEKFRKKYPDFEPKNINGYTITHNIDECLEHLDWERILNDDLKSRSVFFHGDLQFDNILLTPNGFKLIDWRQDFAGELACGDLYYDIGKLRGGLIIDYKAIKRGDFIFEEHGDSCTAIQFRSPDHILMEEYLKHLLPSPVIDDIVSLIFLNMSPLHSEPFDKFLFCKALERFNATFSGD